MMLDIFMHKLRPYFLIGVSIFVGIAVMAMPFSVSADLDVLLIVAAVALVVLAPELAFTVNVGVDTAGAVSAAFPTWVEAGGITFAGVDAAGAGIYALAVPTISPLTFLTFGAGVAGVAGLSSNVQQAPLVEGGTCYGPINSCGNAYQGTWTFTYDDDGNVTSQVCALPGGDNTIAPPDSECPATTISVTSPTTDQTVVQGGTLNISWNSQNAPDGSAVVLRLVNTQTGANLGIVARNQTTTGNTSWNLPGVGATVSCADCGGIQEMVPVGTYKIAAKIYTPTDAWFGDTPQPANPIQPTYLASGDSNTFTVLNPAPTITSISPNDAAPGASFTLTVNGTNFVPSSVINFDGAAKTTSFVSVNQLTASILASDIATAGAYPVTVANPTPGGGTSNSQTFTVNQPLPSCVFSATPSAIVPPQSSSLSWNCGNASSCSIDNGIGSVGTSGSRTAKPSQTTTYTLSCNGAGGGASFQTTVRTTRFDIKEVAP